MEVSTEADQLGSRDGCVRDERTRAEGNMVIERLGMDQCRPSRGAAAPRSSEIPKMKGDSFKQTNKTDWNNIR